MYLLSSFVVAGSLEEFRFTILLFFLLFIFCPVLFVNALFFTETNSSYFSFLFDLRNSNTTNPVLSQSCPT